MELSSNIPMNSSLSILPAMDFSFSLTKANLFSLFLLGVFMPLFVLPFQLIWHGDLFYKALLSFLFDLHISLPILLIGTLIHEGIHGFCFWVLGKKSWKEIKFGVDLSTLTPYTHCTSSVSKKAYVIGALAPSILLGIVPIIIALSIGQALLLLWGICFTFMAGADILTVIRIRKVASNAHIQDHPERAGCKVVLPEVDSSSIIFEQA